MNESSLLFLRRLLDAPGPSGFESAPARVWKAEAQTFADEVTGDVVGNAYARLASPGSPVVVIEGHIDEIGLQITYVDEQGYLWFDAIGGWDDQALVGQRIRIAGNNGDVIGVIGRKARHLLQAQDRERAVEIKDLWIDIGAADRAAALARVSPGDPAVIDAEFVQLTDDLVAARGMDNRVGAFVALEALRVLSADRPRLDLYALAAAQEEISFAGAAVATVQLAPAVAIAIDVTHATDYPGGEKHKYGDVRVGGGPVLGRGSSLNPLVYQGLRDAANRLGWTLPVQGNARSSGTDADAMIRSGRGTAAGLVSIPNRYMHSPNEVVSLNDLADAAKLIAEFVRTITPDSDFRP